MRIWVIYTARDSRIGSADVGQPLNLCPACIAKLFKFSCFGAGKAWHKFRAPPWHLPILQSLSVYFLFSVPLLATVNEPFRWEFFSGYRNDRLHWHLLTGGSGVVTASEIYRDVQFWENGLTIKTIYRDLVLSLKGSYSAFGRGTVFQKYGTLPFATDEPEFRFSADGWAADTSGYFGYAANLTSDRTYKAILIPWFGYSAHFERLKRQGGQPNPWTSGNAVGATSYSLVSSLPGWLHLTWFGAFIGGGFLIDPGGRLVFSGGYNYHFLNSRFKTEYKYTASLFNPALTSETENSFQFKSKGSGNLGQTGWAQVDYVISSLWRTGLGAEIHYYSTELRDTTLNEQSLSIVPPGVAMSLAMAQKLKIRWTSIAGWIMASRTF